jgi:hypothetical protein
MVLSQKSKTLQPNLAFHIKVTLSKAIKIGKE